MIKNNKIMICLSTDNTARKRMIEQLTMQCGFASVRSDARKIINASIYDVDLTSAYFVIADNFKINESLITTQKLFEMASRGICVIVGCKKLPVQYEFLCQVYYPENLL